MRCFFLLLLLVFTCLFDGKAQRRNNSYNQYIEKYYKLAVEQDNKHKVPASVTLAQALLESGAGQSDLAKRSNNHFGIKCHSNWKGAKTTKHAEKRNECFRKYKHVKDSYEDHSLFLRTTRYEKLFKLKRTDYKGWAKGLQSYGYATDKSYATKLIKIIEDYDLHDYDYKGKNTSNSSKTSTNNKPQNKYVKKKIELENISERDVFISKNGLLYVISGPYDTYGNIALDMEMREKDLRKFNDVPSDYRLQPQSIVYLMKKNKKADKPYYTHKIQRGESMYSISQQYGIRLDRLYKMNKKDKNYIPTIGDMLKLR